MLSCEEVSTAPARPTEARESSAISMSSHSRIRVDEPSWLAASLSAPRCFAPFFVTGQFADGFLAIPTDTSIAPSPQSAKSYGRDAVPSPSLIPVHRVVLASQSRFFFDLFSQPPLARRPARLVQTALAMGLSSPRNDDFAAEDEGSSDSSDYEDVPEHVSDCSSPSDNEDDLFDEADAASDYDDDSLLGVWDVGAPDEESLRLLLEWFYFGDFDLTLCNAWSILALAVQTKNPALITRIYAFLSATLLNDEPSPPRDEVEWAVALVGAVRSSASTLIVRKILESAVRDTRAAALQSTDTNGQLGLSDAFLSYKFVRRVMDRREAMGDPLHHSHVAAAFEQVPFDQFSHTELRMLKDDANAPKEAMAEALRISLERKGILEEELRSGMRAAVDIAKKAVDAADLAQKSVVAGKSMTRKAPASILKDPSRLRKKKRGTVSFRFDPRASNGKGSSEENGSDDDAKGGDETVRASSFACNRSILSSSLFRPNSSKSPKRYRPPLSVDLYRQNAMTPAASANSSLSVILDHSEVSEVIVDNTVSTLPDEPDVPDAGPTAEGVDSLEHHDERQSDEQDAPTADKITDESVSFEGESFGQSGFFSDLGLEEVSVGAVSWIQWSRCFTKQGNQISIEGSPEEGYDEPHTIFDQDLESGNGTMILDDSQDVSDLINDQEVRSGPEDTAASVESREDPVQGAEPVYLSPAVNAQKFFEKPSTPEVLGEVARRLVPIAEERNKRPSTPEVLTEVARKLETVAAEQARLEPPPTIPPRPPVRRSSSLANIGRPNLGNSSIVPTVENGTTYVAPQAAPKPQPNSSQRRRSVPFEVPSSKHDKLQFIYDGTVFAPIAPEDADSRRMSVDEQMPSETRSDVKGLNALFATKRRNGPDLSIVTSNQVPSGVAGGKKTSSPASSTGGPSQDQAAAEPVPPPIMRTGSRASVSGMMTFGKRGNKVLKGLMAGVMKIGSSSSSTTERPTSPPR
ncbi:hypothetical protein DFJ73DRAFT_564884 [Zopfochytrium polystomum]|nr:hypothetical protein DFJ73DRAFT_564884 [Zopfochytrium polystomum]